MTSVGVRPQPRGLADRCPGLLRPHVAEDGLLVRLRVPGGRTTSTVLLELSGIAAELGEGSLQLTSRGNLQLRGLLEARLGELVDRVAATGLLPSVTHERVRNIVASPVTGLSGTRPDLRPMVHELDRALCATPELAGLPGRFLFALDDGRGDVAALHVDLAYLARDEAHGTVLVGDGRYGLPVRSTEAVETLVDLAVGFLRARAGQIPQPWRLAELPDVAGLDPRLRPEPAVPAGPRLPLGAIGGAASVGVPLSLLTAEQVLAVDRAAGGGPIVLTPWRGVVIPGAAAELAALARAGLTVDDGSAWSRLTACVGAPGCARSAISTREVATELAAALGGPSPLPVHLSGCERRCGAPATRHVDLVAPASLEHALALIGDAR